MLLRRVSGESGMKPSPVLKQLNVSVITNTQCQNSFDHMKVLDTHVCTGDDRGTVGPCHVSTGFKLIYCSLFNKQHSQ